MISEKKYRIFHFRDHLKDSDPVFMAVDAVSQNIEGIFRLKVNLFHDLTIKPEVAVNVG